MKRIASVLMIFIMLLSFQGYAQEDEVVDENPVLSVSFYDIAGHPAQKDIEYLASLGIIKGRSSFIFDPDGNISRAEYIALCIRLLNIEPIAYDGIFEDVSHGDWFSSSIATGYYGRIIPSHFLLGNKIFPNQMVTLREAGETAYLCYLRMTGALVSGHEISSDDFITRGDTAMLIRKYYDLIRTHDGG